jgi:hypothetical protein
MEDKRPATTWYRPPGNNAGGFASSIVESVYSLGIDVRVGLRTGEIAFKDDDIGG